MAETTRTQILDCASRVFAERGYQATTIREICQRAGTNLASVNYHFGDKKQLYREAVQLAYQSRAGEVPLPEWSAETPPQERVRGFIQMLLTRMVGDKEIPWQSRLLMREVLNPTAACQDIVQEYFQPVMGHLMSLLGDLLPRDTSPEDRLRLAFSVVGQCLFYRVISGGVVSMMVAEPDRKLHFSLDALSDHIARVVLSAVGQRESFLSVLHEESL